MCIRDRCCGSWHTGLDRNLFGECGGVALSLTCQSGLWAKVYKVSTPTLRYGGWGNIISNGYPDASFAACAADEIVVGGGGECSNPTRFWLHDSRPANMNNIDGWYANCFGRSEQNWQSADDTPALAYACLLYTSRCV